MYSKKAYLSINKAKISYIPLKQYDPYQPGLQDKHLPFRTLHVLSLQVLGHGILHSFPYTPSILHPTNEKLYLYNTSDLGLPWIVLSVPNNGYYLWFLG